MELDEILHRKRHLEWLFSWDPNPGTGQVNFDDMEKEDLKGLLRFVLERDEAKDRQIATQQQTIEGLMSQLSGMNRLLADIKSGQASSEARIAESSVTISALTSRLDELLSTIDRLQKELKEANKYKRYKEKYEDLRCDHFGSKS